nr:MAG TPA: hypothetical protein [Caudoviricetes sp.]
MKDKDDSQMSTSSVETQHNPLLRWGTQRKRHIA